MIYVDDARQPYGSMKMSHLMADSTEELEATCDALGLKREYIQYRGQPKEHIDVSMSKRRLAVKELNAKEVSGYDLVMLIRKRRGDEHDWQYGDENATSA